MGFYGQDDFRVLTHVTLNVGLRYEFQTVPHDIHGVQSALRDVQHDAAATVGAVFENHRCLISARDLDSPGRRRQWSDGGAWRICRAF